MINSKLVIVLRTFSNSELKGFEKFVQSPFFNKGRNYLPFLKELKKFYPDFDNNRLTYEYIFSKIYPGRKFSRQIIWNMNSSLMKMAEEYLIHINLKKNHFAKNTYVADEFHERKLSRLYEQRLEIMERSLKKEKLSEIFFDDQVKLILRKISLHFLEDRQSAAATLVTKKGEYVIMKFITQISNVVNNLRYNQMLYNSEYNFNISYEFIDSLQIEKVIEYAKLHKFKYTFVLEIYYCLIMTSLKPADTSFFFRAKEIYEANAHRFDEREQDNLISVLSNYCIFKLNGGDSYFSKMLFEVNLLQLKLIDEKQQKEIGKIFFLQVFRNALLNKEIEWAKKFIDKYTPCLKHSYQKPMRALADAFLSFKLKDYNNVIKYLSKVRFIDTRDKFYVRSLSLRAYYELGEIPTLLYHIQSAKHFVTNNRSLSKFTGKKFNDFLNHLNRLVTAKENNDRFEINKIRIAAEKDKSLINRDWLLEKISEIK